MTKVDLKNTYTKLALAGLVAVVVTGTLGMPQIYAMSHNVLVQVRNNATLVPESGAVCQFTFSPSGTPVNATANSGGVAMITSPSGANSTFVSCTGADGTSGNSTAMLKTTGNTVIEVLTS